MAKKVNKTKYYHASPKRVVAGTILVPAKYPNFEDTSDGVFLTTSPIPHHTVVRLIEHQQDIEWHVYEVTPIGKIYAGVWDDLICDSAEVIRYIGNAKGIILNKQKKFKPRQWKTCAGSSVDFKDVKAKVIGRGIPGGKRVFYPITPRINDNGYR